MFLFCSHLLEGGIKKQEEGVKLSIKNTEALSFIYFLK